MGTRKILQRTKFGPILALRRGESLSGLAKRQTKAFKAFQKSLRRR